MRQFQFRVGHNNFALIHVSMVPDMHGEQKTKPTQTTIHQLRGLGLMPDIVGVVVSIREYESHFYLCRFRLPVVYSSLFRFNKLQRRRYPCSVTSALNRSSASMTWHQFTTSHFYWSPKELSHSCRSVWVYRSQMSCSWRQLIGGRAYMLVGRL